MMNIAKTTSTILFSILPRRAGHAIALLALASLCTGCAGPRVMYNKPDNAVAVESLANPILRNLGKLQHDQWKKPVTPLSFISINGSMPEIYSYEARLAAKESEAVRQIRAEGEGNIPDLVRGLNCDSPSVCSVCEQVLIGFGRDSVQPVLDSLRRKDAADSRAAAVLVRLGPLAYSKVFPDVYSTDAARHAVACSILVRLAGESSSGASLSLVPVEFAPELVRRLHAEKDPGLRKQYVSILSRLVDRCSIVEPALIKTLESDLDAEVRSDTANYLRNMLSRESPAHRAEMKRLFEKRRQVETDTNVNKSIGYCIEELERLER